MRIVLAALTLVLVAASGTAKAAIGCAQAASLAERAWGLPPDLLLAIGLAESGALDRATARLEPTPFSVNFAGSGVPFASAAYAENAVAALRRRGIGSIDVGCFQINLRAHPDAFAALPDAFDPVLNASYAAAFLSRLFHRTGSWSAAIAVYHSADPARGAPYRDRVLHFWRGLDDTRTLPPQAQPDPHVIRIDPAASGIPIYTPATLPANLRLTLSAYINP